MLSLDTPEGLLHAVFFYNGKNFCLRGGEEQRGLKFSQLKRSIATVNGEPKVYYEYTEHGSKNRTGGLKQLQMENKVVRHYESEDGGDRCHVRILDKYLQKVPKEALEKDSFYVKPLTKRPLDPLKPWFSAVPIGKNKLSGMVKAICLEAGLAGSYTNHSLRASGATALFSSGVSEALVQHRTGHRSLEGLRKYERVTAEQELQVSSILSAPWHTEKLQPTSSERSRHPSIPSDGHLPLSLAGCSFSGCTINFTINQPTPTPQPPPEFDPIEELKGIDIQELLKL